MGWVILVGLIPLIRSITVTSFILLMVGGLAYTMGTIWYRKKNIRGSHIVWHSFVLLGTICHWFSIWFIK
jgi:hemolysin III